MIDDAAFASSISLEHVYFSEGSKLMVFGSNAFYGCKALRRIILPDSVEDIWKPDILEYMLKIVQEKEYLSLIAYILEKLPKRKSNVNL